MEVKYLDTYKSIDINNLVIIVFSSYSINTMFKFTHKELQIIFVILTVPHFECFTVYVGEIGNTSGGIDLDKFETVIVKKKTVKVTIF